MRWFSITSDVRNLDFIPTHVALVINHRNVIHSEIKMDRSRCVDYRSVIDLIVNFKKVGVRQALQNAPDSRGVEFFRYILGKGVDVVSFELLLKGMRDNDVYLIRHPDVALMNHNLGGPDSLYQRALFHLDKPYNPFIGLFSGAKVSAFCSQLVYEILKEAGLSLPERDAHRVLPLDFLIWALKFRWQVVSGAAVFAALETYYTAGGLFQDYFPVHLELYRHSVQRCKRDRALLIQLNKLPQSIIKLQDRVGDVTVILPDLLRLDIPVTGYHIKGVISAADNIYCYLMQEDYPPGCTPSQKDSLSFFNAELPKSLNWSVPELDANLLHDSSSYVLNCRVLKRVDKILRVFVEASGKVVACLEEYLCTSSHRISESVLQNDSFKALSLTMGYFNTMGWEGDKESCDTDLDTIMKRIDFIMDSIGVEYDAQGQMLSSFCTYRDGVSSSCEQVDNVPYNIGACIECYILVAYFALVFEWKKNIKIEGDFDKGIKYILLNNPVYIVESLGVIENAISNYINNKVFPYMSRDEGS